MTRKIHRIVLAVALVLAIEAGFWYREFLFSLFVPPPAPRAPYDRGGWATKVDAPPLENFYRVTPGLYRGAQPDAAGMRKLKELGIKTVVNLRLMHSDADEIAGLDIASEHIRIDTLRPEMDELVRFLRIATDPNRAPVFVHCMRGIDRTGLAVAVYRIVVCGWTKAKAEDEMINGPFGHDSLFPNIQAFLENLDVDELRRRLKEGQKVK
jgi:protein tyrosine/serine phosphatase